MPRPGRPESSQPARLIACALWIGLAYGLLEGIGFQLLRLAPWAASALNGTTPNILWIAPLEYAAAFGLIGLLVTVASRFYTSAPWDVVLVFLLIWIAAFLVVDLQDHHLANYASAALGCGVAVQIAFWYRRTPNRWAAGMMRTLPHLASVVVALFIATVAGSRIIESRGMRSAAPSRGANMPNVLLLVIDTQRADHLSTYGYSRKTTPRLDELAGEGVLFEQAHSSSSWTLPSHASLMTGRSPHEHRAGDPFRPFLDNRYPTLAEAFRQAGYVTGGFVANTYWAGRQVGLDRGFIRYEDHLRTVDDALFKPVLGRRFSWNVAPKFGWVNLPARQRADALNAHLLEWIDDAAERPFFAFVNYMDVHGPYLAPAPYATMFSDGAGLTKASEFELAPTTDEAAARMTNRLRQSIDSYDGSLAYLDHEIGELLGALDRRGLRSNTLVIVTSDHGESFGEHGLVNHGNSLYLDQTRVPLIIRFPGRVGAGIREPQPVSLTGLAATILSLTGHHHPGFTAEPFVTQPGVVSDEAPRVRTEVARRRSVPSRWPTSRGWTRALITERWHFIQSETGEKELYDLAADTGELHNLAHDGALQTVVADLDRELTRQMANDKRPVPGARVAAGVK